MERLRLDAPWFENLTRWRWRLSDADGSFLADHEVRLNSAWPEFKAFLRLDRHLRVQADPRRVLASEAELLDRVGQWIGERVLGPVGPAIVEHAPVTVAVQVPQGADVLLYQPLELAHVGNTPLVRQEVSLVFLPPGKPTGGMKKDPIADRLRMLAIFSLPTDEPLLVLRQQRYALVRMIRRIAARSDKAIDLTVLQYGVTRDRLEATLADGAGWDLVHFSGHGLPAGLLLEHVDGTRDRVSTTDLLHLLWPGRKRLKLLTLSSCDSAAATANELIRLRRGEFPDTDEAMRRPDPELPAVAQEAVQRLDCAVLAMRYAVGDEFSIALADHLYEYLLAGGHTLARALQLALPKAIGGRPEPGTPPLSVATPVLFGVRAIDLQLKPPPRAEGWSFNVDDSKLAHFPDEPERFIGRTGPMAAASRALLEEGASAVLFQGPAAIGKTTCALELAYRHEHSFQALVWHQGPATTQEVRGSLNSLAAALERQLPRFRMTDALSSRGRLEDYLPYLTQLLEERAVLIVLDGLDALVTADGRWRDEWWARVVDAMLRHSGLSRTVVTMRERLQALGENVLVPDLAMFSPYESVALARQLKHMGNLMRGRSGIGWDKAMELLGKALTAAGGLPGLLVEADQMLADPREAQQRLARTGSIWDPETSGSIPAHYDDLSQDEASYLPLLKQWMQGYGTDLASVHPA